LIDDSPGPVVAGAPADARPAGRMTASATAAPEVVELDLEGYRRAVPDLVALCLDAVAGGASINFLADTPTEVVTAWWEARGGAVASGLTTPFVARLDGATVGCTLLARSGNPNSPHRAEIGKVIVHRSARRRGIARALMLAAEARARADGRWLLVLDTVEGSAAHGLYRSLGWHETGVVPNYALDNAGNPEPATFFWKDLR
jgi:ribosomal protein S18 acetylase RimI-like enzyme